MGKFPVVLLLFVIFIFYFVGFSEIYSLVSKTNTKIFAALSAFAVQHSATISLIGTVITVLSFVAIMGTMSLMRRYARQVMIGSVYVFTGILAPVSQPPYSAVFVLAVSVSLALIASWITMRFSDMEKMKANMEEIKEWRRKLDVARKTMDPMLLQEVQDQQARIMRINAEMMGSRMKPMCIYYIPFVIIFIILNSLYAGIPVAILPFNAQKLLPFIDPMLGTNIIGDGFGLWFWPWYLLSSLGLGNLIRKALGVGVEMGM